jgi:hypothetical protein
MVIRILETPTRFGNAGKKFEMPEFLRPGADECAPYYANYIDQVPENIMDIMQHLKRQGLEMLTLMRTLDDARGDYKYAAGKWSIKEVVGHLIDAERLFAFRALWIARGDNADQPGMDQDIWAANSNAGQRTMAELWREQHVCRTDHVYLLKSLNQDAIARRGVASGSEVSVRAIPWIIAGHERHHLNVLKELYGVRA